MDPPNQDNNPQPPEDRPSWQQRECEGCGAVTNTNLPHCQVCRGKIRGNARVQERRNEAKKQRICVSCLRRDAAEGVQFCAECGAHRNEYMKNRRDRARDAGKCSKCIKNDAAEGRAWCQECLDKENVRRQSKKREDAG
ncbi:hypothetical protein ACJZ2D_012123 [Fusarium nematophilum]